MKALLLILSLTISVCYGQSEIRLKTEFSLAEKDFRVFNDLGQEVVMTDMLVWSENEVSIFLEPGGLYSIRIDSSTFLIFPIVETSTTIYAMISYADINSGFVTLVKPTEQLEYQALKTRQTRKQLRAARKAARWAALEEGGYFGAVKNN